MKSISPSAPVLTAEQIGAFQEQVWSYYRECSRSMPWRDDPTPFKVVVSELMLQQTQVSRVIPKFEAFMYTCTDFASLAALPLAEVLRLWSGLGYNRRAKYLHQLSQTVVSDYGGVLPATVDQLIRLPGIGKNTAGAIMAYAYDEPVVFVETNIRTVYFHHFYPRTTGAVSDRELAGLVDQTLDRDNVREWYWALMDYGSHLKKTAGGRLTDSRHYVKQAPLKGSVREMRGALLKELVAGAQAQDELERRFVGDARFAPALESLKQEGFLEIDDGIVRLTGTAQTS